MENVGFDIGSFKTVLSSSTNNGTVISDDLSKRFISSVVEISSPVRKFGNHVGGPLVRTVFTRSRYFTDITHSRCDNEFVRLNNLCDCQAARKRGIDNEQAKFCDLKSMYESADKCAQDTATPLTSSLSPAKENEAHLFFFLNYLKKYTKAKTFTLSVPFYYSASDRKKLFDLCSLNGIVPYIVTDISAVAFNYFLMHNAPNTFCILDCGHSKTTFGVFENVNGTLTPKIVRGVKVGGLDFDEKLIAFVMGKFGIPHNKMNVERVLPHVEKMKKSLNNLDDVRFVIETPDDSYFISITKNEYLGVIKEDLAKIEEFVSEMGALCKDLVVEIVGGNSFHFYIQQIVKKIFPMASYVLNPHEICSTGCALFGAVKKFGCKKKIAVSDINLFEISYAIQGEERPGETGERDSGKVANFYDDSQIVMQLPNLDRFVLDFYSNGSLISSYSVQADSQSKMAYKLAHTGLLEVLHDKNTTVVEKQANNFSDFKNFEEIFEKKEQEILEIGKLRNSFENQLNKLPIDRLNLDSKQKGFLENLRNEIVYEKLSESLKEEIEKIKEFENQLDFVKEKISEIYNVKSQKLEAKMHEIEEFLKSEVFVRGIYLLKGKIIKIKDEFRKLENGLKDAGSILDYDEDAKIKDLEFDLKKVREEIQEKVRQEKEEKERKEKEAKEREKKEREKKTDEEKKEREKKKKAVEKTDEEKKGVDKTNEEKKEGVEKTDEKKDKSNKSDEKKEGVEKNHAENNHDEKKDNSNKSDEKKDINIKSEGKKDRKRAQQQEDQNQDAIESKKTRHD